MYDFTNHIDPEDIPVLEYALNQRLPRAEHRRIIKELKKKHNRKLVKEFFELAPTFNPKLLLDADLSDESLIGLITLKAGRGYTNLELFYMITFDLLEPLVAGVMLGEDRFSEYVKAWPRSLDDSIR